MTFFWRRLSVLVIFIFLGCHPSVIGKFPSASFTSIESWPEYYHKNHNLLRSMQSEARISIETPTFAVNFTAGVIYVSPDTLFMQAEGPFGLDLGKIMIGKNRFILFNQFNNQFFSGSLDDQFYNTFLETSLSLRQIRQGMIGYTFLPENPTLVDTAQGIYAARGEGKEYRYIVDLQKGYLQQMEIKQDTVVVFRMEFKNYTVIDGILLPRLTRMILPHKNEMVAIYHKNIKINPDIDRHRYFIEIGPKTKQIIIGG